MPLHSKNVACGVPAIINKIDNCLIGKKVFHFSSITSTQDACAELIENGESEGVVVIADEQTQGRGRGKRPWISPKDEGLYLSILLKPRIEQRYFTLIVLAAALSIVDVIKEISKLVPTVKWPNDVLVNSKKISGILAEKKDAHLILGMGVNINSSAAFFPDPIKEKATSLKIETGEHFDRRIFLSKLLQHFEKRYVLVSEGRNSAILKDIKNNSCTLGRFVSVYPGLPRPDRGLIGVNNNGRSVYGRALDFNETGALIIEDVNGKILEITSGDILYGGQGSARSNNGKEERKRRYCFRDGDDA